MDLLDDLQEDGLYIDAGMEKNFKESANWAKFISIAGMLISAILVVTSFTLGSRVEAALNDGFLRSGAAGAGYLWVLVILLFSVALFVLCIYMFRFANRMQLAISTSDKYEFVESLRNLRNMYKALAILFSVYFLAFIGATITKLIS